MFFLQQSYEDIGFKTVLIITIIALCAVIRHLHNDNKKLNSRIGEIYENHKTDLQDANKDFFILADKFQSLVTQLKDIVKGRE